MQVIHGDCLDVLAGMADASFDAVVTDPPYNLDFMGHATGWDDYATPRQFQAWCQSWAVECLRVLKPGGHLLAFGAPRSYHRLACGVEDAGFELRDSIIAWAFAQGFPKSLDISKAIDKAAGCEREVVGEKCSPDGVPYSALHGPRSGRTGGGIMGEASPVNRSSEMLTAPATELAQRFDGYGTALKPSFEPVVVARRPLVGTVAQNVERWGVGGINVDGCRIPGTVQKGAGSLHTFHGGEDVGYEKGTGREYGDQGRWPTNMLLCHSPSCVEGRCVEDCHVAEMDRQSGNRVTGGSGNGYQRRGRSGGIMGDVGAIREPRQEGYDDSGGASRFYPCFRFEAKADSSERMAGPDGMKHVTVKPVDLMRWLIRLVSPPSGGLILDPFAGSGSTLVAAFLEDVECVGIEKDARYVPIIEKRLEQARERGAQGALFG